MITLDWYEIICHRGILNRTLHLVNDLKNIFEDFFLTNSITFTIWVLFKIRNTFLFSFFVLFCFLIIILALTLKIQNHQYKNWNE